MAPKTCLSALARQNALRRGRSFGPLEGAGSIHKNSSRYALAVLTAVFAVNQLDRNILAITLNAIGQEFSLSDTQLGLLSGALFVIVYVLFGFPVAKLAARGSRRNIMSAAIVVWSGLTIAMAGAQNFTQLALARLGVGLGEAGAVAPAHSMISDLYPPERRTSAMGANIGVLLAFLVGGIAGQMLGWRWAFVIAGVPGLALAVLLRFTIAEPARSIETAPRSEGSLFVATWKMIWNDRGLFHAMWGLAITGIVTFGALAWNATFIIRGLGLSQAQTGIYLSLSVGILGGLGTWGGGVVADRLGAENARWRLGVVVAAILIAKPFAIAFLLIPSALPALACLVVSGSLAAVFWGPTYAFLHSRVEPHMRPMATAIFLFVFNIVGVGIGPTIIGFASDNFFANEGARSLSYAILIVQIAGAWGAWHYWRAMKTIAPEPQSAQQTP